MATSPPHPVYSDTDAATMLAQWSPRWGEDLTLRVYTSRLLGSDPSLVLHGGGNTSVKTVARDATGDEVDVLYVKGSGSDLSAIGPEGFPACRLGPLLRYCRLPGMTDEEMVAALRSQMLDPGSPTPSVEALLHAFLPGTFVDHTHADAVLTVQDQPNARELAEEIWGPAFLFIPYVMPGFVLARRVVDLASSLEGVHGLILEQHGIFTWGGTARESYERMIAGVTAAEQWRAACRPPVIMPAAVPDRRARSATQRQLAPLVRGVLASHAEGRHFITTWRDDPAILALTRRPDGPELTARGTVTPDHVIRTKPRPLWLPPQEGDATSPRNVIQSAVAEYADRYREYFARGMSRAGHPLTALDPLPRVILVPGLGALTLGRTLADAVVAGDIVARAAAVMQESESVGRYHPVSEADLFDVEYWSLEQAKLARGGREGPLAGRIALVTGAAAGIGRATAEHLLSLGAHVLLTDVDQAPLADTADPLRDRYGRRVATAPCDVTDTGAVSRAVEIAIETFGGVDLLISNAGTAPTGLLHTGPGESALERSLEINLLGHQRVAHAVTRVLLAQGSGGCLLFNASKSAVNQGPEFGPYAIPKAGVLALMRQYAVDLGPQGIRANAVNADRIRTGLFGDGVLEARARARGVSPDDYFRQNLLGRETTAQDVAEAFGWLATAEATTGCYLTVDGGNAAAFPR